MLNGHNPRPDLEKKPKYWTHQRAFGVFSKKEIEEWLGK